MNSKIAADLFSTIKAYRPGLKNIVINAEGILNATMKSKKAFLAVAFDLRLTGMKILESGYNTDDGLFYLKATK